MARRSVVTPHTDYPVNLACLPKGWEALTVLDAPTGDNSAAARRAGKLRRLLDTALKTFVDRFKRIQEKHGAEAVAFLSTADSDRRDGAVGSARQVRMGMKHGDGNTRQCMATSWSLQASVRFDAPPYT